MNTTSDDSVQPRMNRSDDLPPPPIPPPTSTSPDSPTEEQKSSPDSPTEEQKSSEVLPIEPMEEDIPAPPEEESEETMKLYPKKHLQELPKDEILALKSALVVCARKMKYNTAEGASGEVNAEVLTRLILSRPSLLHGASWFVSQIDGMKDEEAKKECIEDTNLFKSLLKIVLRDPIINCGSKEPTRDRKLTGVISLDVPIPSYDKMKSFLFYSKEHRKSFAVSSDKFGALDVPKSFVNEDNIFYYYLKQLIIVHKDKFHNNCHRHYDLDVSYLHPPLEGTHARELLNTMPIWSHLDAFADGFVNCENMGVSPKEEIVVVAYKGRNFKRFDLTTCCPLSGCLDTVLPMDCDFLGCNISNNVLQTMKTYDIGTETANKTYEERWVACISPSTCKRHLKERIKSIPHTTLYELYVGEKKIKEIVPPGTKENRAEYHPNNPCKNLRDSITVEKLVLDALWDEAKRDSKVSVAHLHVMKNGDILCVLEDTLWNKDFHKTGRPNYETRGFTVLWYRFQTWSNSTKQCSVTVVARFNFVDFKKTAIFVNGKSTQPYPVNVRKYVTRENVSTFPNYGSSGKCDVNLNCSKKETQCFKTTLINRIATADVTKCTLSDGRPGRKLSFAMLVDCVEFDGKGNEISVQDEIWSTTCFVVTKVPFTLVGVAATRLNKEHICGRVGNSHLKMSENGVQYTKISNRGFYDRKRTRLNVESFDHGKETDCSCYLLSLSDFSGHNQKQTLVLSWSESYRSILDSSFAIPMLFPPTRMATSSSTKKRATEVDSLLKYDTEEINHANSLSSHLLPGPFSRIEGSTIVGTSRRYSSTPVVLVHKARNDTQMNTKKVDTLSVFDVHVPSNSFTVYEKDSPNDVLSMEMSNLEENGDVTFDFDKSWLVDNLLVTIENGKYYPCVRVYKMEIPESTAGGGSSLAKLAKGSSFLLDSTESLFLLNSTKLGSRRVVDPKKFYGPRKSILGGVYKTKAHVALLLKDDPKLGGIKESSVFTKRHFGDKSHCGEIGQCKSVTDGKTLRIYSKLWKESWASKYYLSKQKLVDSPEKTIDSSINNSALRQGATFSNSFVSNEIQSNLFYDFDISKVCTNPRCRKAGCGPCEEKTDCVSWHFCSEKCYNDFYDHQKALFK